MGFKNKESFFNTNEQKILPLFLTSGLICQILLWPSRK